MGNKKSKKEIKLDSSFRDPSGYLYTKNGKLLRQVNKTYKQDYDLLFGSGLNKQLTKLQLLITHEEENLEKKLDNLAYKIIKPKVIPFISYPYEWCFSQLKDAALTTLKIQKIALNYGMSLKDASAYNIQFLNGKPILIDTLSFEKYKDGKPWAAYKQFCQHFLSPLALASYVDIRLTQLLRIYIDGIPLDLTVRLLPKRTLLNVGLLTHLHLHAKAQKKYSVVDDLGRPTDLRRSKTSASSVEPLRHYKNSKLNKQKLLLIIDSVERTIKKLKWKTPMTEWGDYYDHTNYSQEAFAYKKRLVQKYIQQIKPETVWDLGANTGEFSRIASSNRNLTIAFDIDPLAVEKNYQEIINNNQKNILPLVLDLNNPSPSLGWSNKERDSIIMRGPADMIMALALVHHLAISNNLPFENIALFFSNIGKFLIIEFVPKTDSQVQKLLATREDIFDNYTQEQFEKVFKKYFAILQKTDIKDSKRMLYLMKKK